MGFLLGQLEGVLIEVLPELPVDAGNVALPHIEGLGGRLAGRGGLLGIPAVNQDIGEELLNVHDDFAEL